MKKSLNFMGFEQAYISLYGEKSLSVLLDEIPPDEIATVKKLINSEVQRETIASLDNDVIDILASEQVPIVAIDGASLSYLGFPDKFRNESDASCAYTPYGVAIIVDSSYKRQNHWYYASVLVHELTHYHQIKSGRLIADKTSNKGIWEGELIRRDVSVDQDNLLNIPWEAEAYARQLDYIIGVSPYIDRRGTKGDRLHDYLLDKLISGDI